MTTEPEDPPSKAATNAVLIGIEHHEDSRAAKTGAAVSRAARREIGRRHIVLCLSVALVLLAGAALWRVIVGTPPSPNLKSEAPGLEHAESAEFSAWRKTALDDPLALRRYLDEFPTGRHAHEAQKVLERLETEAWERVLTTTDAHGKLREIDRFELLFKDSARTPEATQLRQSTSEIVASVQAQLITQGFSAGPADGVISERTIADVERYQSKMGLPTTGLINLALLQQLEATNTSPTSPASASRQALNAFAKKSAASPSVGVTPGTSFRDCYVCPEMVWLPLGKFQMGDAQGIGESDELPVHSVTIAYELAVGKYEITFEEWDACLADGGCGFQPDDMGWGRGSRPVINVSWNDAREYAVWLSRKTGKRYRLLSEAEWEYAARAGAKTAYSFGNSTDELCRHANHADQDTDYSWRNQSCSDGFNKQTAPIGSFAPNAFGLYDMHGNVWEWVEDCWHETYESAPASGHAWTHQCTGADKILRGGSWSAQPSYLRTAYRYRFAPRDRMPFFGFRVARQS